MRPEIVLTHEFVRAIPEELRDRTVYVSIEFGTVAHKCSCGCGNEVVTPLTPTDWKLIFDGETVSLDPSVGSWNLPCQSHYWIQRNRVHWSPRWSRAQIDAGRKADACAKARYYGHEHVGGDRPPSTVPAPPGSDSNAGTKKAGGMTPKESAWRRLRKWLAGG